MKRIMDAWRLWPSATFIVAGTKYRVLPTTRRAHRGLDGVLKFKNDSRSAIGLKDIHRFCLYLLDILSPCGPALRREMLRKRGDVYISLTEARVNTTHGSRVQQRRIDPVPKDDYLYARCRAF